MNLIRLFDEVAARTPDQVALIEGLPDKGRITTFQELYLESCHIAALLNSQRLKPGQYVLIALPVSATLYAVIAALFRCGLVPVFVDPSRGLSFMQRVLEEYKIDAVVSGKKALLFGLLCPRLRKLRYKFVSGYFPGTTTLDGAKQLEPMTGFSERREDSPALITFTSGSTGMPKGVIRTHGNLYHSHRMLTSLFGFIPGSLHLAFMPMMVISSLSSGVGSLLPATPPSRLGSAATHKLIEQVRAWQPENTVITPGLLSLVSSPQHQEILAKLKNIIIGGAPVMPGELQKTQSLAPEASIRVLYGSTEAEPITSVSTQEVRTDDISRMNSGYGLLVGEAVAGTELRILRDEEQALVGTSTAEEFEAATLEVGEIGEIVVTGPHVVSHYLNGRGEEMAFIRVGATTWLRTGDAGRLDEKNRLWLLGRCKSRIREGETSYYPLAVEPMVALDPRVKRSAYLLADGKKTLALELSISTPFSQADIDGIVKRIPGIRIDEVIVMKKIPVERRLYSKTDLQALRILIAKRRYLRKYRTG